MMVGMPGWHVHLSGRTAHVVHNGEDADGGLWTGDLELWRGAASWDSHPEILHAVLGLQTAGGYPHDRFFRHQWSLDVPERYEKLWNCGADRRYVILKASGGVCNWTLVVKLPRGTPDFLIAALLRSFHATAAMPARVEAQPTAAEPASLSPPPPSPRRARVAANRARQPLSAKPAKQRAKKPTAKPSTLSRATVAALNL